MPNVELIRGIFISYNIFKLQDPRSFIFELSCLYMYRQTDRQTRGDEIILKNKIYFAPMSKYNF